LLCCNLCQQRFDFKAIYAGTTHHCNRVHPTKNLVFPLAFFADNVYIGEAQAE
jgi:hypothetical protein